MKRKMEKRFGEDFFGRNCVKSSTPRSPGNGFGKEGCLSFHLKSRERMLKGNYLESLRCAPWNLGCALWCQIQAWGIIRGEAG